MSENVCYAILGALLFAYVAFACQAAPIDEACMNLSGPARIAIKSRFNGISASEEISKAQTDALENPAGGMGRAMVRVVQWIYAQPMTEGPQIIYEAWWLECRKGTFFGEST